ncbi:restriction endonuclease [Meridianimaribacter flavus]
MEWKEYEEVTKYIYETLGKNSGVEIECFGNSCKVTGKSTVNHQVDVLTKHSDGLHNYRTAIECKYWDKNINKDIIMKVAEIVEDAQLNKGIIVSKLGFTPDAIDFARYRNIGLVELRELTEKDWEGRVKDIIMNINMLVPEITGLELIVSEEVKSDIPKGMTRVEFLEIQKETGEKESFEKYIKEFNSELTKKEENEELSKVFKFDKGTKFIYTPTQEEIPIHGFMLSGVLRIAKSKVEIKGEDHIWLIMKSIFEDKTFTISKDGEINERKEK